MGWLDSRKRSPLLAALYLHGEIMEEVIDIKQQRKSLVPKWIKFFGWIFILLGSVAPLLYIASAIFSFQASYELYGLSYNGNAYSIIPLIICVLASLTGVSAYGLLFAKNWGLMSCLVMGYVGLTITVLSMFITPDIMIRLEPLIQIPYLIKLHKIKSQW